MITYKLLRIRDGKLYPMFVDTRKEMTPGKWLKAEVGELVDERHVKSRLGPLALRPGFHSTEVPFTDWIGKRTEDGTLVQRPDTVWCECEVEGNQEFPEGRSGKQTLPSDWYYFRTKPGQPFPWIISNRILIRRLLGRAEVETICREHGVEAQQVWDESLDRGLENS